MMPTYKVIAINRHSGRQRDMVFDYAPSEQTIIYRLRVARPGEWFATRYYPSRKGWLVLDFEHAHAAPLRNRSEVVVWKGFRRLTKVYPSEDAAVMKILYMINAPKQVEINL